MSGQGSRMNRKSILILICAVVLVMALIGGAVHFLYSGVESAGDEESSSRHSALLGAVPSDAAAVFCFTDVRKGVNFLSDPSGMFATLFSKTRSPKFLKFLDMLKEDGIHGAPMVVSMHFSGNVEPLMIVDAGRAGEDTSAIARRILAVSDSSGLDCGMVSSARTLVIVSASETLVGSSMRHAENGTSILDDSSFSSVIGKVKGNNALFVSHDYAPQLVATYLDGGYRKYSDFLKRFSDWTAMDIDASGAYHLTMHGASACGKSDSYYLHLLEKQSQGESRLAEILPSGTSFSVSLTDTDFKRFSSSYDRYLDASSKLPSRLRRLDTLTAEGMSPLQWRERIGVREVARVEWNARDTQYVALFVRTSEKHKGTPEIAKNAFAGFAAALYGDIFSIPDESCMVSAANWIVFSGSEALSDWMETGRLNARFPSGDCIASVVIPPTVLQWTDQGCLLEAAPVTVEGVAAPAVISSPEASRGPFKVTNCATGKTNELYQNDKLAICLKDENGKGLWGVPFDKPLCGYVGEVDCFKNGKIQYIFCAGSDLYVIDRLGRFVKGFPVSLGKEVALGPAVYDFSGTKQYSVVVLHADNTIGMYDLQGHSCSGWNGITTEYAVTSLPELTEYEGGKYWVLTTANGKSVYPFAGGDPLKGKLVRNILK